MSGDREYTRDTASSDTENRQQRPYQSSSMQLNAEAQEWYPANHKRNANAHAGGGREGRDNERGERERFSVQGRLRQFREPPPAETKPSPNVARDFDYLQGIIARLTSDPGHFEEVIDIFMQTLQVHLQNNDMMAKICGFIFVHAIEEPSFRYNAARLCVLIQDDSHLFKAHLENLCLREVEKNRQQPGFTLFLAEIYTQSKFGNWKMLYDALNKLISLGGDENIKTVCQTLKLSGFNLEAFNKLMMDDLIGSLELQKQCVQRNVHSLIESVINLRISKWGHGVTASSSGTSSFHNPYANLNNSVPNGYPNSSSPFYGPSGEELTEADRRFMDEELFEDLDDPDELYDPEPEMDEEIQAAFKEFVKMSK